MSMLSEKLAPLWAAINRLQARQMSIFPATVTSVNPVRIRIDGESQPLAASPATLAPMGVGSRVRVLRYGTTHLILGTVGHHRGAPWRQAAGTGQVPLTNSTFGSAVLTMPSGRFTVPPIVTATVAANTPVYGIAGVNTLTPTTVRVYVRRLDGTSVSHTETVSWHAIQMTPTSAEG